MLNYEKFEEAWNDLERRDKIALFNEYACEYCPDDQIYNFDEDFFETYFSGNPMEAVRAAFFGEITCWNDEYIRFNGYGNLVSMSDYQAAEWADEYTKEIYEHENLWSSYIDEDDYDEDEWKEDAENTLISVFEGTANMATINTFVNEQWDEDENDETNIIEFRKWFRVNRMDEGGKYKLVLDEDATDKVTSSFDEDIDYDIAARFVEYSWDYDMSDEDNIQAFADWYENMNGEKLTIL